MRKRSALAALTAMVAFCFLALALPAFGGTTGKLRGKVTDAETGEPLPGVNIIFSGYWQEEKELPMAISLGTVTDLQGEYVVINIPPGRYSVRASILGYAKTVHTKVTVNADRTTTLNFELTLEALQAKEIVVTAEREQVKMDVSASQISIQEAVIQNTPSHNRIERLLLLQPGIDATDPVEGKFTIRGSRQNEVAFMVDGLSLYDEKLNEPYMNINQSSVQEIQILTGGFNAEYGNARSGVLNIITKEGSSNRWSGSLNYRFSPAQKKHFGPDIYDFDWKVYGSKASLSPDYMYVTGYGDTLLKGGWPKWLADPTNQIYTAQGPVDVLAVNKDNDPNNDITAEDALNIWRYQHRRFAYGNKPDHDMDVSLSGPLPLRYLPLLGSLFRDAHFFASYKFENSQFAYPQSRDHYWDENTHLKITQRITPNIRLTVQGLYGEVESVQARPGGTGEKDFMHSPYTAMEMGGNDERKYILYHRPILNRYRSMVGAKLTHTLSPQAYYEFRLNRMYTKYWVDLPRMRSQEPMITIGHYQFDETPLGWTGKTYRDQLGLYQLGLGQGNRDNSFTETVTAAGDLTYQFHPVSELKTGFEFVYNHIKEDQEYNNVAAGWRDTRAYNIFPKRFSYYVQDKLEFEGLIANIGLRFDCFDADFNTIDMYTDPFGQYLMGRDIYWGVKLDTIPRIRTTAQYRIAPRIGVSHPLSASSKIFFNYGHFYQLPDANKLYTNTMDPVEEDIDQVANPNLKPAKTMQMEVGFSQSLFNTMTVDIVGYYKDMRDEISDVTYVDRKTLQFYETYRNNGYADIRGFEIRINKTYGRWITGWLNYNYMEKSENSRQNAQFPEESTEIVTNSPYASEQEYLFSPRPIKYRAQPYLRAGIDLHTPSAWGPVLVGTRPLADIRFNFFYTYYSGSKFTYYPVGTWGPIDNMQWLPRQNTDLRFSKTVRYQGAPFLEFYLDVDNLFNQKVLESGSFFGQDWTRYLESLKPEEHNKVGISEGAHLYLPERGAYKRFLNPRRFYFGLRLAF